MLYNCKRPCLNFMQNLRMCRGGKKKKNTVCWNFAAFKDVACIKPKYLGGICFLFFSPSLIVHLLQYIQWSASSYLPFLINCEDYDTCILMRTQFLNRYRGAEEPYGVVWHEEIRPPMLSVHCHQLGHLLCFCSGWTSVDSLPLPPQSNLLYLYETSLNRKPSYVGASLDTN